MPEEMKKLDEAGRKAYVAKKEEERKSIQTSIQRLNEEREAFVLEKRKEQGDEVDNTLDKVVVNTVREQAEKKGYQFEK